MEPRQFASELGAFGQAVGYVIVAMEADSARLELDIGPTHLNRNGFVHGGVLTTLMDAAGGRAGMYCTVPGNRRQSVTVSLTVNFLRTARHGRLIATGRRLEGGQKIFSANIEVRHDSGFLVAAGIGSYRYLRGSERPEGVPA
jgi:uncharacterized protein (TIGR00369 family)